MRHLYHQLLNNPQVPTNIVTPYPQTSTNETSSGHPPETRTARSPKVFLLLSDSTTNRDTGDHRPFGDGDLPESIHLLTRGHNCWILTSESLYLCHCVKHF